MNKQQASNDRRQREAEVIWTSRRDAIIRLYESEMWSQQAIADHYGVTLAAMQKVMLRLAIKSRSRANTGPRNGRYKNGLASTIYRTMVEKDSCAKCGATESLCIHHKDENHYNNDLTNLEVLCMSCHSSMHKREWWSRRGTGRW